MMQPIYILFGLLILIVLVWFEIKRASQSFLAIRILATIIAVLSVLFLIVPSPFPTKNGPNREIILLSEGYNQDSVEQLIHLKNQPIPQIKIENYSDQRISEASMIHLFGNGFTDTNQVIIPEVPIQFHPADKQTGIQNIHWQESIVAGSPLLVQGSCVNLSTKKIRLVIYGWNKAIDSIEISAGVQQQFSFSVLPKNEGRGLYHLAVIFGNDSLEKESIAYQVRPAKAFKVLMLAGSPNFDTKFLKNWLADFGYTVISKTTISKEKFQNSFSNTKQLNFEKLTASLLADQDLVISDQDAIQTLSSPELAILKKAIVENGLGLIVNVDSLLSKKDFISDFITVKNADSNQALLRINRLGETNALSPIKLKQPLQILDKDGLVTLFEDQQKRIFASATSWGSGKLIVNTLQKTSSWLLMGNKNDYQYYWTTLLNRTAKKDFAFEEWEVKTELPRVEDAILLSAQTNNSIPPLLRIRQTDLAAKQHALIPSIWEAIYWPSQAGWHSMVGTNGTMKDWYVYPLDGWKNIYANQQIRQTKQFLKNRQSSEIKKRGNADIENRIPAIYLFLIFLTCMSFLWLERKFQ